MSLSLGQEHQWKAEFITWVFSADWLLLSELTLTYRRNFVSRTTFTTANIRNRAHWIISLIPIVWRLVVNRRRNRTILPMWLSYSVASGIEQKSRPSLTNSFFTSIQRRIRVSEWDLLQVARFQIDWRLIAFMFQLVVALFVVPRKTKGAVSREQSSPGASWGSDYADAERSDPRDHTFAKRLPE